MITFLNQNLVKKQGLSEEDIGYIESLHHKKANLFDEIKFEHETAKPYQFEFWVAQLRNLEFRMQDAWGFDIDDRYHEWYKIPHCTCPMMDNEDYRGTTWAIYSEDCPFHGHKVTKRKEAQYQHNREIKRWNEHDFKMIRNSYKEAIINAMDKVSRDYND